MRVGTTGSGFTLLFEALVLAMAVHMPMAAVARLVGEHATRLWRVVTHYVDTTRAARDDSEVSRVAIRSGPGCAGLQLDLDEIWDEISRLDAAQDL